MEITGDILIGGEDRRTRRSFIPRRAADQTPLAPVVCESGPDEADAAARLAAAAFDSFRRTPADRRAEFLDRIAVEIEALGAPLIDRAAEETGLPAARLAGERARTAGQLRLFAEVVRAGRWLDLRWDPAQPERTPVPRPDLRQRRTPLGPVAVFGASNFPLAFSTAGGDSASALAAGCPVVVKGHPAHPGTGELVARAVRRAVAACGLHEGVFSYLPGSTHALGAALVRHPAIKAVGFTGSRAGGLALARAAAERPEPIPVYAEMSSINPVFLLPGALAARGPALAEGFAASLTLGVGQFCTNPGLVIGLAGPDFDAFAEAAAARLAATPLGVMLTADIREAFMAGAARLAAGAGAADGEGRPAIYRTDAARFLATPALREEVFGPAALLVACEGAAQMRALAESLEGQLTASLHLDAADHGLAAELIERLELRCGRLIANGWPTGVEVAHAMVHGGPYPATTDGRSTSVGSAAIERFLRPVCYQDLPEALLPPELRGEGLGRLPHLQDGTMRLPPAAS